MAIFVSGLVNPLRTKVSLTDSCDNDTEGWRLNDEF